jgi:hypothetical protein
MVLEKTLSCGKLLRPRFAEVVPALPNAALVSATPLASIIRRRHDHFAFLCSSSLAISSCLLFRSSGSMIFLPTPSGRLSTSEPVSQCLKSGATSVSPQPTFASMPLAQEEAGTLRPLLAASLRELAVSPITLPMTSTSWKPSHSSSARKARVKVWI